MTISIDFPNGLIESTASILDLPVFHAALRDLEDDATGAIYPVTHTWKALDLGGGAFMYQMDLNPYYSLKFPTPGNYSIKGNLNCIIVPVVGVYVERQTSLAYATTAIGGSGPSAADIAAASALAVWSKIIDGLPASQLQALFASAILGKVSGAGTGTEVFRDIADTKNRITTTVDANGNRTAVTLDGA